MHITAPFVAALAAFAATAEAKRYICDRQNYATVAKQILNPAYFCKFYLKDRRVNSPLREFGPKQLTHLCHCFVQNSPRVRGPLKSVPIKGANYNVCNQKHVNAIRNQYKQPLNFAKFWRKGKGRHKFSPMPTIPNVRAVEKAAECVIASANNPPPPAGSTTAVTTAATTAATTPASSGPQTTGTSAAASGSGAVTSAPIVVVPSTTAAIILPSTTVAVPRSSTTGTSSTAALPCILGIGPGCPAPSSFSTSTTTSAFSSAFSSGPITASPSVQTTSTTTSSSSSTLST